jgi:intein/homing endonuclease
MASKKLALVPMYGAYWDPRKPQVMIELECLRLGGKWTDKEGHEMGMGMEYHYATLQRLLWPDHDDHRWHQLTLKEMVGYNVVVLMGPKSAAKTCDAAKFALCEYWIDPENTLVLMSSTDLRSLDLRIWGETKMLFEKARELHPYLAGHLIESKRAISTDDIDEDRARDLRKGIIAVPCVEGGKVMNLKKYQGIKQKRMIICADELAAMANSFLSAFSNLDSNDYFKAILMGNPNTMHDPLGRAAEPKGGWDGHMSPEKTDTWDTRFMGGRCVNLIGTDSPNFDFPDRKRPKYPYLISQRTIDSTVAFFGKDSMEYHSQCVGDMQVSQLARQVLTRQMCEQFHAFDQVVWGSEKPQKIYAIDAAYGGDRCVGGYIEFGKDVSGNQIISIHPPVIIPIRVNTLMIPEDQIVEFVMADCGRNGIDPQHVYYDATGRGSLGTSFARRWSDKINPIEFGGPPTDRPVCSDMYVWDSVKHVRRLKTCKEHYIKFVTELWFSVRYAVEAGQVRNMPEDVLEEFCWRQWDSTKDDKKVVETKEEMKERVGRSPDLADWCCFVKNTMILTPSGEVPIQNLKEGDTVITPFGITTVALLWERENKEVMTVKMSNGRDLTGTPDHKVFTKWGWERIDSLTIDAEMDSCDNIPIWNTLNALFTKVKNIGFKALASIIQETEGRTRKRDFYIELSGRSTMGIFLLIIASIIRMEIGKITKSKIWNWLKLANTHLTTSIIEVIGRDLKNGFRKQESPPQNGMVLKKVLIGIAETPNTNGRYEKRKSLNAYFAKNLLWPISTKQSFVPALACKEQEEGKPSTKKLPVWSAVKRFLSIATRKQSTVRPIAAPSPLQELRTVYNLTLDEHNAYYANGVLVQNCITVEGARREGFAIKKLLNETIQNQDDFFWDDLFAKEQKLRKSHQLHYA